MSPSPPFSEKENLPFSGPGNPLVLWEVLLFLQNLRHETPVPLPGNRWPNVTRNGGRQIGACLSMILSDLCQGFQEGTNAHLSNVHFVLCENFGLNPIPCPLPPPPLYCLHTKGIQVGNHEPQEGSSNAEISRRTWHLGLSL